MTNVAGPESVPISEAELALAAEFPAADRARWQELVAGVLRKSGRLPEDFVLPDGKRMKVQAFIDDGFVKIVADAKYGEILGVHIIGPYATEIIAEAVTALELEATVEEMMFTVHAHPTVAEALLDGFSSVEGKAVNV